MTLQYYFLISLSYHEQNCLHNVYINFRNDKNSTVINPPLIIP